MLLGLRILENVQSVNSFAEVPVARHTRGDLATVYFQLVDLNQGGVRYVPLAGAIVKCTIENIDSNKQIKRFASQPFQSDDRSIWAVQFMQTDKIQGTANLRIQLIEGTIVHNGVARNVIRIEPNETLDLAGKGYRIDPPDEF